MRMLRGNGKDSSYDYYVFLLPLAYRGEFRFNHATLDSRTVKSSKAITVQFHTPLQSKATFGNCDFGAVQMIRMRKGLDTLDIHEYKI